jgi:RHS repeat-associated protein
MNTILVGDPVDVITGAQFDVALDFQIAWPFPFEWRRFYSTARVGKLLPLGWGHTHSYDHRLKFDANGLLYVDPTGARHGFNYPSATNPLSASATGTLRRINPHIYRVKVGGQPECEFHFTAPAQPAQLRGIFLGRARHELRYGSDGRWNQLVYKAEPPIRIVNDAAGCIRALIWAGADNGRDRLLWAGEYDHDCNLIRIVDPYQTTQAFGYDDGHHMVRRVDRRGYGFEASYDGTGRCERSSGDDGMQEVRVRYVPGENLTIVTRADKGEWQYFYQQEGIAQIIDPYFGVTRRVYGADGRLTREIGPMGEVLREVVDEESGLLSPPFTPPSGMCLPLGDPWFEPVRELLLPADALGWEGYGTALCRDEIRFPWRESSWEWTRRLPRALADSIRFAVRPEEGETTTITLGRVGPAPKKPMGIPDAPGIIRYDAFGLLISHVLPTGHTCRWRYDPNGNVARYIDYAGSEWRYDYASWNLCVREINPLGHAVTYAFNALEKPIRVTDAGGTVTAHDFDLKDRMIERRRHAERRDLFRYDRSYGLASAATGSSSVRATLKSGPQQRPVEIAPAHQPVRRCAYDEEGQLVSVTADDGESVAFAYDAMGNCTADLQNGRGVERRYVASRLVECAVLEKFVIRYIHDTKDDRVVIVDPMGGRHVIQQLHSGVFLRRHANSTDELAQFDWNGQCLGKFRLRANESHSEAHRAWSRIYRYSPVGTLLTAVDSARGSSRYEYDAAHRLVGAIGPDGRQVTFTYDAAGNLLAAPGLEGVSYAGNRILTANGRRFEYNERHHIVHESGIGTERRYKYDVEDRLALCHSGGIQIEFHYDALGRRIAKTTPERRTEFIWDGERLAAEIFPKGALRVYVYADDTACTPFAFVDYDSTNAEPESGCRCYIFSDQIACPILVEDDAGEVLWRAQINVYGHAVVEPKSSVTLNLRWPGHYFDSETGLHYNRHRYYSPELGRYIQVDPRDLEAGPNVYAYPARPLDTVDVDGLAPCKKKPMVRPRKNKKEFEKAKKRADKIDKKIRAALEKSRSLHPQTKAGITLATMVVLRKDGKFEVVVTSNVSPRRLPRSVREARDGARWVAYGGEEETGGRPPNVTAEDEGHRYSRTKPNGEDEDSTHTHAEQRGLRAMDCDKDVKGVAYIAPTRRCCEGCSNAIKTPASQGGWGGNKDNVSNLGRQPGQDGSDHW